MVSSLCRFPTRLPCRWWDHGGKHVYERCFTCTVWSEKPEQLAFFYLNIYAIYCNYITKCAGQVGGFYGRLIYGWNFGLLLLKSLISGFADCGIYDPIRLDIMVIFRIVWNRNLKRWAVASGLGEKGMSSKTTRKSIESWMISADIPLNVVCLRQGHDSLTSMRHYQGLPFTDSERSDIKRRLAGWI